MSPRQSKSSSRSTNRTRGKRGGGKSTGRGGSPRSLSASRRATSNTRGGASSPRRGSEGGMSARSKRGRRSESSASHAVKLLQQDHRAVAEALEEFESAEREEKQAIAQRICRMLTVHSQIEEELLYPAARDALHPEDEHLVAEAGVEHASLKDLIRQIEDHKEVDEQYEATVCVLGEYVKHHVSEEENEIFPRLERSSLDLEALGERLEERKSELMGEEGESRGGERAGMMSRLSDMASGTALGRGRRPSGHHAHRH